MASQHSQAGDAGWTAPDAAEAWRRGAAARAQSLGPAMELMLDLAEVEVGSRVLDVAAGTGEQTLVAARRVGPTGFVIAIDIAATMLQIAAEAARGAGLTNVATRVMDAARLDLDTAAFDAVISRCGLEFISDLPTALAEMRRVLKPGGKIAAIVWSTPGKNPRVAIPLEIAGRYSRLPGPAPGQPGMFSLAEDGILAAAYRQAGFREVARHVFPTRRRFSSAAEALRNLQECFPRLQYVMGTLSEAERALAWAEIARGVPQREGPDGFEVAGELLIGVGTK